MSYGSPLLCMHMVSNREPRCGCSSSGRAPPCQGGGSEFEPRHPLQFFFLIFWLERSNVTVRWTVARVGLTARNLNFCQGQNCKRASSPAPNRLGTRCVPNFIWYRGQVVRQESAKLSFPSSNLGGTSKNPECVSVRDFTFLLFTKTRIRDFWKVRSNSE